MSDLPIFMFAFANADRDLEYTQVEYNGLNEIFDSADGVMKRKLKYGANKTWISDTLSSLKSIPPSLLHFSGHAGSFGLRMHDNELQTGLDLAAILKNYSIKILFLNGCGTSTLVKEIFAHENAVEAIIATRGLVTDNVAAALSCTFYKSFVLDGMSLDGAYTQMIAHHSSYSLTQKLSALRYDQVDEETFSRFDAMKGFSWGLFSKNAEILNTSVSTLLDNTSSELVKIENEIGELREMLKREQRALDRIVPDTPDAEEDFRHQEKKVKVIVDKIWTRNKDKEELLEKKCEIGKAAIKDEQSTEFTVALKNLNYAAQRKGLKIDTTIGGVVMPGDENSVLELLYRHFIAENELHPKITHTYLFDDRSAVYGGFWAKIATGDKRELQDNHFSENDKKEVVRYLMKGMFLGKGEKPHQNILFKIVCTHRELTLVETALEELWKLIHEYIIEEDLTEKMKSWNYKLVFVLLDETAVDERKKAFDALIERLKANVHFTCFEILEKVDNMTQDLIHDWIASQTQLSKMGFKPEHAEEYYVKSQGAIKRFLELVREKVNFKVSLLDELRIY